MYVHTLTAYFYIVTLTSARNMFDDLRNFFDNKFDKIHIFFPNLSHNTLAVSELKCNVSSLKINFLRSRTISTD